MQSSASVQCFKQATSCSRGSHSVDSNLTNGTVNGGRLVEDKREEFRHHIQSFIRLYGYISQIISFKDIDLEKLYIFLRFLNKKLPKRERERLADVFSYVDLEYFRIEKKLTTQIELEDDERELQAISAESGGTAGEDSKDLLSHIIEVLNESFGSDLTDDDKVNLKKIQKRLADNEELRKVHISDNTKSNKRHMFDEAFDKALIGLVGEHLNFYKEIEEPKRNKYVKDRFYESYSRNLATTSPHSNISH